MIKTWLLGATNQEGDGGYERDANREEEYGLQQRERHMSKKEWFASMHPGQGNRRAVADLVCAVFEPTRAPFQ
jgi:hypothetical protein